MAPTTTSTTTGTGTSAMSLIKRYYTCSTYGYSYSYGCSSRWYDWGRWVVLAGVVLVVLLVLLTCACTARRRRRRGAQPMYGTGWMAPGGKVDNHQMNNYQQPAYNQGYPPNEYNNQPQQPYNQGAAYYTTPPPYPQQQQSTGTTFNPNDGYYGNQQYGVQQPPNAYQRDGGYAPPAGAPPGK